MGNNDWMWVIAIALIIFASMSPLIAMVIFNEPPLKSDYQYCLDKCGTKINGDYYDRECPVQCLDVKNMTCEGAT